MSKQVRCFAFLLCAILMLFSGCTRSVDSNRVQVEIWHTWNVEEGGTEHILQVLVDEFNASQSEVEAILISQPSEGFSDKVYNAVASGVGPDVYFNFANSLADYVAGGFLADMGKYMDTNTLSTRIPSSLLNECYGFEDGKLHIIPIQTTVPVLFYNATLYQELGLNAPSTWADLENNSRIIYEERGIPGFAADSYTDLGQMLFVQTGATYIDTNTKTVGFNTPECVQELEWYADNVSKGWFTTAFSTDSIDSDFNAGLLGAFLGTCSFEPYIHPDGFKYATAPAPTNGVISWVPIFSRGAVVFASDEVTEKAACDFISFFTNATNSGRWSMGIGALSPYGDAIDYEPYRDYVNNDEVLLAAMETLKYAGTTPAIAGSRAVRTELQQAFLQTIGGNKSAQEALTEAEANCNAALQE